MGRVLSAKKNWGVRNGGDKEGWGEGVAQQKKFYMPLLGNQWGGKKNQ